MDDRLQVFAETFALTLSFYNHFYTYPKFLSPMFFFKPQKPSLPAPQISATHIQSLQVSEFYHCPYNLWQAGNFVTSLLKKCKPTKLFTRLMLPEFFILQCNVWKYCLKYGFSIKNISLLYGLLYHMFLWHLKHVKKKEDFSGYPALIKMYLSYIMLFPVPFSPPWILHL